MDAAKSFDCFISYSSSDLGFAEELHRRLCAEGLAVWFDRTRLNPGCDWRKEIKDSLVASRVVVPILTPRWKHSEWTLFETYGANSIVPVIAEGRVADVIPQPLLDIHTHSVDFASPVGGTWARLAAAIRSAGTGRSQKASRGSLPEKIIHFPMAPLEFSGRTSEIRQLTQRLSALSPCVVLVVGLGGQGKSTLVWRWWETNSRSHFGAVFWCTASQEAMTFDTFLDECLTYLMDGRYSKNEMPTADVRVQHLLELMRSNPVLIVIDGLECWLSGWNGERQPDGLNTRTSPRCGAFEGLNTFLAEATSITSGSHLVCTSQVVPQSLEDARVAFIPVTPTGHCAELEGLDDEAAVELLKSYGATGDRSTLLHEAHRYDNHALALSVLGKVAECNGGSVPSSEIPAALDPSSRLSCLLQQTAQKLPHSSHCQTILAVVGHCMEGPSIDTIWAGVLAIRPWRLWLQTLIRTADFGRSDSSRPPAWFGDLVSSLADRGLVDWNPHNRVVRAHPVVKQFFAQQITNPSKLHGALSAYYAGQPLLADGPKQFLLRVYAFRHALKGGYIERCEQLLTSEMKSQQTLLDWLGNWGHFELGCELLEPICRQLAGIRGDELRLAWASFLRQLGQHSNAEKVLDELIVKMRLDLGSDAAIVMLLAGALMNRGNLRRGNSRTELISDFDEALRLLHGLSGERAEELRALAYMNRGMLHRELGESSEAIADCDRAATIFQGAAASRLESLRPQLVDALCCRANALADARRCEEALHAVDDAVDSLLKMIDTGRREMKPILAHCRVLRGAVLDKLGRHAEARGDFESAIGTLEAYRRDGRRELEQLIALAHMARAQSFLRTEEWDLAIGDADRAVDVFSHLEDAYRLSESGRLGTSLLNRSEARIGLGDITGAALDQSEGMKLFRRLIDDGRLDTRIMVMRKIMSGTELVAKKCPDELDAFFKRTFDQFDRELWNANRTEEIDFEVTELLPKLNQLAATLVAVGVSPQRMDDLRTMLNTN